MGILKSESKKIEIPLEWHNKMNAKLSSTTSLLWKGNLVAQAFTTLSLPKYIASLWDRIEFILVC